MIDRNSPVSHIVEQTSAEQDGFLREKIDGAELSRRECRASLTKLYDRNNMQVKLKVAMAALIVAPVEARRLIEATSKTGWLPQAADAKETIRLLDNGFCKPG